MNTIELSKLINLSLRQAQRLVRKGIIRSKKYKHKYYISQNAVDEYLKEREKREERAIERRAKEEERILSRIVKSLKNQSPERQQAFFDLLRNNIKEEENNTGDTDNE